VSSERPPGPEREVGQSARGAAAADTSAAQPAQSAAGANASDGERRLLERIVPEIVKRIVEAGYEKISEGPENVRKVARDLKLPKEAIGVMFSQLEETKNGLYRAVAREVRDFLENTNFAEELTRALTTLSFEIKTEVRFIPNDSRSKPPVPDVRSKISVKRRESVPPAAAAASAESERPQARQSQPPPAESPSTEPKEES
jgi:hypothetical protein